MLYIFLTKLLFGGAGGGVVVLPVVRPHHWYVLFMFVLFVIKDWVGLETFGVIWYQKSESVWFCKPERVWSLINVWTHPSIQVLTCVYETCCVWWLDYYDSLMFPNLLRFASFKQSCLQRHSGASCSKELFYACCIVQGAVGTQI